jgi:hypothetical protein
LELATSLNPSTEYELVAVSVTDKSGNTIESWVDWMVTFSTPSELSSTSATDTPLNSAWPNDLSAPVAWDLSSTWVTWSGETWSLNAADAAKDANALPTTWPKEMMILVLALILGWVVVFVKKRKMI